MLKLTDIDFNAVWQETFGWNTDDKSGRKFDDQAESDFWVKLAPHYTEEYNLNHDTPLIAQRLHQLLGSGHSILEIGCGSADGTLFKKYPGAGFFTGHADRTAAASACRRYR